MAPFRSYLKRVQQLEAERLVYLGYHAFAIVFLIMFWVFGDLLTFNLSLLSSLVTRDLGSLPLTNVALPTAASDVASLGAAVASAVGSGIAQITQLPELVMNADSKRFNIEVRGLPEQRQHQWEVISLTGAAVILHSASLVMGIIGFPAFRRRDRNFATMISAIATALAAFVLASMATMMCKLGNVRWSGVQTSVKLGWIVGIYLYFAIALTLLVLATWVVTRSGMGGEISDDRRAGGNPESSKPLGGVAARVS